ncbi:MAG: PIN domain-containing protein [Synergistaceae bacterium]|jgi:predicted nucleic acid-binding protein|nr:PIN domain-containing protein [Synergistaceae bacterium]
MTIFALDTNIVSGLLKRDVQIYRAFMEETDKGNVCIIPPIVYYEIRRGLLAIDAGNRMKLFKELCLELVVGEMEIAMWNEAARMYANLRKAGNVLEDADLFIAAFCVIGGYTLVTRNTKHFTRISGLEYVNWMG